MPNALGGELDADLEVADEQGHAGRLAEDVGVLVEEGDGTVEPFVDDGGVGRPEERRVHVLRAGQKKLRMISVVMGSVVTGAVTSAFPLRRTIHCAPATSTSSVLVSAYERRFDQASIATATTMIAPLTMSW